MNLRVNGEELETQAGTIAELLAELRLPGQTLLIEKNGHPTVRGDWPCLRLSPGDSLELLKIAAGG